MPSASTWFMTMTSPVPGQPLAGHGRGHRQQCPLVARWREGQLPDVVSQVKRRVVGPERSAAAGRRPAQPLPEPGHGADALAEQPLCFLNAEAWPGGQDQHGTDMRGRGSDVRSKLHQVGRAGLVHRHPPRHACAHVAPHPIVHHAAADPPPLIMNGAMQIPPVSPVSRHLCIT